MTSVNGIAHTILTKTMRKQRGFNYPIAWAEYVSATKTNLVLHVISPHILESLSGKMVELDIAFVC